MMKFLKESGKAVKAKKVVRIPRGLIEPTIKAVIAKTASLGITKTNPIGSTGKKPDSGDIDLGVAIGPVATAMRTNDKKVALERLRDKIASIYGEAKLAFGNTISFPVPIVGMPGKFVQMDFMFTNDLQRQAFFYHNPEHGESKYKGAYRNLLLVQLVINHDRKTVGDTTHRYWFTTDGVLQKGTEKMVNGKRVVEKEDLKDTPGHIVKMVLGKKYDVGAAHSFETLLAAIRETDHLSAAQKKQLFADYKKTLQAHKLPPPPELDLNESVELTEGVSHMAHLEDSLFENGIEGGVAALKKLKAMANSLVGHGKNRTKVSIKWDGSPTIIAGVDPADGKFFVARRGLFNKEPRVYKTAEEITHEEGPQDLKNKMLLALRLFPALGLKRGDVIQGDFLFGPGDVKQLSKDGQDYVTFHPNTILYAVPANTETAKEILHAKVGVVWHTKYHGKSLKELKATYNTQIIPSLKRNPSIWMVDAALPDISGSVTFTGDELAKIGSSIDEATKILSSLSNIEVFKDSWVFNMVKRYSTNNDKTRQKPTVDGLIAFIKELTTSEEATKKTVAGRLGFKTKAAERLKAIEAERQKIEDTFKVYYTIQTVKNQLIEKLDSINKVTTFLKTKSGIVKTGHEGFVVADHLGNNAVKFVNRDEFTRVHFSKDTIHGW